MMPHGASTLSVQPDSARLPEFGAGPTARGLLACLDGVADGVVIGDRQGNLVYWNTAALRLHGYASLEQARRHVADCAVTFVLTDTQHRTVPFEAWPFARLMRGETVSKFEATVTRTDTGQSWTVQYDGEVVADDPDGRPQLVLTLHDLTDRRRAERELIRSQAQLRQLIEGLPQLVWTCRGEDGGCDYVGPQYVQYTGVPLGGHFGNGWLDQVHPDDREALADRWRRAVASGLLYEAEYRLRRADGAYRWFNVRGVPSRDGGPNGRVVRWFGTSTDVHDERQAARSAAVLAAIVEHSDDAIVGKTLDGTITSWNRAAQRMFGYTADEAVGRNVLMLLPADRTHEERDILARIGAGETIEHFESRRVAKDGRVLDVSLTISPIRDGVWRVVGASKIARDITARLAAERAVRSSEEHLRAVLDGLLVYVAVLGPGGRLGDVNRALRRALASRGVDADGIEGRPVFDLPFPGVRADTRTLFREAVARAALGEEVRLDAVPVGDGPARVLLDLMLSPMRRPGDGFPQLILSAVDVTDRERSAQQARDQQAALAHLERVRTMGQMAAGLAHELNQPFAAIVNYAAAGRRLLDAGRLSDERLGQTLDDVRAEALRAGAIVQRLRGFVQKHRPHKAAVAVNDVVADALRLFAYDLREAGIEARVTLADGLPPVSADAVQIGQVMVNLIRNALESMVGVAADRRVLTIDTAPAGRTHVRVAVGDAGCGVPPEALARVFDAFFTTKPDGMGIGLALCRTIMEEHGGEIVAVPNPAGGMTFAFTLRTV